MLVLQKVTHGHCGVVSLDLVSWMGMSVQQCLWKDAVDTYPQWPPLEGDLLLDDEDVLGLLRKCYCRQLFPPLYYLGGCANSSGGTACPKWPLRVGKVLLWPKDSFVWKYDSATVEHGAVGLKQVLLNGWDISHWLWRVVLHALEIMCRNPCLHKGSRNVHCKVRKESQWILHLAFHAVVTEACLHVPLQNGQLWEVWQRLLLWYVSSLSKRPCLLSHWVLQQWCGVQKGADCLLGSYLCIAR